MTKAYGSDARRILGDAKSAADLGTAFGGTLTAAEVDWLVEHEFARTAEDIVWRRTKLGLRLTAPQVDALQRYLQGQATQSSPVGASQLRAVQLLPVGTRVGDNVAAPAPIQLHG
jgi:glycerol-3-phosphate dehydrogenase